MNKRKFLLPILGICVFSGLKSQVGINTETPKATLHVETQNPNGTNNEGILVPKVSKSRMAAIAQPVPGTLLYVDSVEEWERASASLTEEFKAKVADVSSVGFYYYNGDKGKWMATVGQRGPQGPQGPQGARGPQGPGYPDGYMKTHTGPGTGTGTSIDYALSQEKKKLVTNVGLVQWMEGKGFVILNGKENDSDFAYLSCNASSCIPATSLNIDSNGRMGCRVANRSNSYSNHVRICVNQNLFGGVMGIIPLGITN
ncbi:hypothetical protein NHN20_07035 [Riemerella anatipestifer]|uniref:hypothetical protein n=1 Tax=Riemerella anatipestifer TaxID=34085 RepID=UPI00209724B7|nr:hypothetical protein [Riemerella anatipestifer]MCO7355270.1 hypothetical protein [Riemerella anatipestifer]